MPIKAKPPTELPDKVQRRQIRKQAGITIAELARYLRVSKASISYWESGQRDPRGSLRAAYAQALSELADQINYEATTDA